jgi:predicted phosphodiesterase
MKSWIWVIITIAAIGLVFGLSAWYEVPLLPRPSEVIGFQKGPYLLYPGKNTQMTILWQLNESADCTLEWGVDTRYEVGSVITQEINKDHQHRYTLTDLFPGTNYVYRVGAGERFSTGSFRAAPPDDGESVKFLVYGDTRSYPQRHDDVCRILLNTIRQDSAYQTFLLHAGDWVEDGNSESDWDKQYFCRACFNTLKLQANLPILGCTGNHEGSGELFQKYWPYPFVADRYWSFDYGPVHVVTLDQYADYSPGSTQYQWLERDLQESTKPWKFVLLHEPGWSAGHHQNNVAVQEYLQPLFEVHDVAMVIAGHNHYYARCEVNGVWHLTTGGGGAPLYSPDPSASHVVTASERRHFCTIEIEGDLLTFQAVGEDGTILDTFSMTKSE